MPLAALPPGAARALFRRLVAAALAGAALVAAHTAGAPLLACPLRATTGLPCPFCGSTTAALALGHGDLPGALHAGPLLVLAAPLVILLPALRPAFDRVSSRWRTAGLLLALAASQVWQLSRSGLL